VGYGRAWNKCKKRSCGDRASLRGDAAKRRGITTRATITDSESKGFPQSSSIAENANFRAIGTVAMYFKRSD
jgi:hypothetical protein